MIVTGAAAVGIGIGCFILGCCCTGVVVHLFNKYAGMLAPR